MRKIFSNFIRKHGNVIAALGLLVTTTNVNSTCFWINNQPELPKSAKSLRKF